MRQYQRKAQGGLSEPNDRKYSRKMERKLKRMRPEDLDELLHGEGAQETPPPPAAHKPERETRWSGR
jgi:hypothetical protein